MKVSTTAFAIVGRACRISWKRMCLCTVVSLCLFMGMLVRFSGMKTPNYKWYLLPASCHTPDDVFRDMKKLLFKMHEALDQLEVPHAVCYGTLWGALRNGEILAWDNNVDICVTYFDIVKVDRAQLINIFALKEVTVAYDSRQGHYVVNYGNAVGYITIFMSTFYKEMFRTGWVNNIQWWFNSKPMSFPSYLLESPLPTVKIYDVDLPVPQENIELLKYLYPDDWWLEVKPQGCP